MAINWSSLGGSGGTVSGQLRIKFISGMIFLTPTGTSTISIPAPPSGQTIILYGLITDQGSLPGVSVVGSVSGAVINAKELSSAPGSGNGRFAIGRNVITAGVGNVAVIPQIVFQPDESVSITKTSGNWAGTLFYGYAYASES